MTKRRSPDKDYEETAGDAYCRTSAANLSSSEDSDVADTSSRISNGSRHRYPLRRSSSGYSSRNSHASKKIIRLDEDTDESGTNSDSNRESESHESSESESEDEFKEPLRYRGYPRILELKRNINAFDRDSPMPGGLWVYVNYPKQADDRVIRLEKPYTMANLVENMTWGTETYTFFFLLLDGTNETRKLTSLRDYIPHIIGRDRQAVSMVKLERDYHKTIQLED